MRECRFFNRDVRPIRQVALTRYVFRVDLKRPCREGNWYGAGTRATADVLGPSGSLTESPEIGPTVEELIKSEAGAQCEPGGDCVSVVECRATYHRDADLRPYTLPAFGVIERNGAELIPMETMVQVTGPGQRVWKSDRYRQVYQCVRELAAERAEMEAFIDGSWNMPAAADQ
jgi:hypothetical protein